MKKSLGMIEVIGFSNATKITDVMVKVANVQILELKLTKGGGWISVFIQGDVAAVQAAIQAAVAEAKQYNAYISSKVIARPANDLDKVFFDQPEGIYHKEVSKDSIEEKKSEVEVTVEPEVVKEETVELVKEVESEQLPLEVVEVTEEVKEDEATQPVEKKTTKRTKKTKK